MSADVRNQIANSALMRGSDALAARPTSRLTARELASKLNPSPKRLFTTISYLTNDRLINLLLTRWRSAPRCRKRLRRLMACGTTGPALHIRAFGGGNCSAAAAAAAASVGDTSIRCDPLDVEATVHLTASWSHWTPGTKYKLTGKLVNWIAN